ncbi:uncharacterized protein PAE49_021266 [Odontesthes bonariensis]
MSGWPVGLVPVLAALVMICPAVGQTPSTVTGDVYKAEEHSNLTLTSCLYPANAALPPNSLQIQLVSLKPLKKIYVYDSRIGGVRYTDVLFRGRLQCDLLLARKGQIECLLADLSLNDTGVYQCVVFADGRTNYKDYDIVVTASKNQTAPTTSKPASTRDRVGLIVAVSMFTLVNAAHALCHAKVTHF